MRLNAPQAVAAAVAAVVVVGGGAYWLGSQSAGSHGGAPAAAGAPGQGQQRGPGGGGGRGGMGGMPVGVVVAEVAPKEFMSKVESLGTLAPREQVQLTANAADRVIGINFEDGQRVRQGATLMTLANDEENALLASAQATYNEAKRAADRNERLAKDGAVSNLELDRSRRDLEAAAGTVRSLEARLNDRVLKAPFNGVLGFRQISKGAYVSPGEVVATLIDDSEMRLEFAVPSIYATGLKRGLLIDGRTQDIPGRTFSGTVDSVDNAIDPVTRSVKVRATLPNRGGELKAGMFMNVTLQSSTRNSLAVPEISIIAEGPKTFVFAVDETQQPSVSKKTEVTVGARERGVVEILAGLKQGDLVVTDGVLKVRADGPVKVQSRTTVQGAIQPDPLLAADEPATGTSMGR
jgi:membrane fusion protein (multidrug efflux system)